MPDDRKIAYFSMEIGFEQEIPTYSGGLGVLAGDTIYSAADMKIPMVAVTLVHHQGYMFQKLDPNGQQTEEPQNWIVSDYLQAVSEKVSVTLEGRTVWVGAWKYDARSDDFHVPVYFLDTNFPENTDEDRRLTDSLYGGDAHYRLCQEVILGFGGVRMLRKLGYNTIERFHMNEGHAAFLTLELLDEQVTQAGRAQANHDDIDAVRKKCVFTTHTPVPAGTDKFPMDRVESVIGNHLALEMKDVICCDDTLNMTYLALNLSHCVNGVAKKHGETSRHLFAPYIIDSITNGVRAATWISTPFQELFDRHIPGWRGDNFSLRYALSIPRDEIWGAHTEAKKELIAYVNRETNAGMPADHLTLGFARRAAAYKRAGLIFQDVGRLRKIAREAGPFQIILAGKAHPADREGKEVIKQIFRAKEELKRDIKIEYLANYDIELARLLTAGVDVWLNTPLPPMEASGTSGMKSALNGVPSFSVLDGWWIEGCIEGVTGWAIGENARTATTETAQKEADRSKDAGCFYDKLETVIIPLFYSDRPSFIDIMRHCVALNGSFFNTQRMMQQYVLKAYFQ